MVTVSGGQCWRSQSRNVVCQRKNKGERVVVFVTCSKQVYMEWMEADVLSIYLPEVKRTFMYI